MKDLEVERIFRPDEDLQFKIAGKTFTLRSRVQPELLAALISETLPTAVWLERADDYVIAALADDQSVANWREIRSASSPAPLSLRDIDHVAGYVMEVTSGRPIEQSSDSSPGSATVPIGPSSKDDSPSPEAAS